MNLTRDEIYILLATAIALKSKRNAYVSIEDIYDEYASFCEQYQTRLKNKRKFIEVLELLSNKGMIDIRSITKISINVPVEKLEKFLDALINRLDNALIINRFSRLSSPHLSEQYFIIFLLLDIYHYILYLFFPIFL